MAKRVFTEEEKAQIIDRVNEIGLREAAEEYEVSWQAIARWRSSAAKAAVVEGEITPEEEAVEIEAGEGTDTETTEHTEESEGQETEVPEPSVKKTGKRGGRKSSSSKKQSKRSKSTAKKAPKKVEESAEVKTEAVSETNEIGASPLEVENAVLKAEIVQLKDQIEKMRKALQNLM